MTFRFTKMHGTGNDYVYVNGFEQEIENPGELSIRISDRHFGIGSDGLILIVPSKVADCRMRMYNADGSEGAMCGNGIRCVAKYAYEHGIVHSDRITVETQSGIKTLDLTVEDGKVTAVETNIGAINGVKAVIIATGTYLKGKIFIGETNFESGPDGVFPANKLSKCLKNLGIKIVRFKTGTPARVNKRSIDFSKMEIQNGDDNIVPFSFEK